MLYLYPSNKTEHLATILSKLHVTPPLSDPFSHEIVLTQSHGMGVWLKQRVSALQGVACMLETQMSGAFIWQLVERLLPEPSQASTVQHFEKKTLRWEIFRQLGTLLDRPEFLSVNDYVNAMSRVKGAQKEAILFQLSEVVADNFDAYQNYRGDWIRAWDQGREAITTVDQVEQRLLEDERWQRALWQALYPNLPVLERRHRTAQLDALLKALQVENVCPKDLPERLFVFGMGAIPVQWMEVFLALAKHIDIHFLFQNPCQFYWGDILTERQALLQQARQGQAKSQGRVVLEELKNSESHPLLASMGEFGKSYLGALYRYDEQDGLSEFSGNLYEEHNQNSALAHIQEDILNGHITRFTPSEQDHSIRFARCHSKLREIECLRDHVLGLIEQDSSIALRDIIVMAPDIQQYSAYIEAVFGQSVEDSQGKLQRLAYGVSDHALSHEQPIIEHLISVLSLRKQRLSLDTLFDLLRLDSVSSRLGFDEGEIEYAYQLCKALNIKWGLSAAHRDALVLSQTQRKEPASSNLQQDTISSDENTWFYALRRALRSYLLGEPSDINADYLVFPVREQLGHEIIGRMLHVLDMIEQQADWQRRQASIQEWVIAIQHTWNAWFDVDALDESLRVLIDRCLDSLIEQVETSGFDQSVDFDLVLNLVRTELQQEKVSQRFLSGRMNFCNLMPMRTVPFKVVCLLGMNEGAYPRHDRTQSFDLMSRAGKRLGDRSRRNDDRYMFLEALLSAQEQIYFSYQGFDPKDNSTLFPSVLLAELQKVCEQSFLDSEVSIDWVTRWTVEHRLHPFHVDYYAEPSKTKSLGKADSEQHFINCAIPASFSSTWRLLHDQETASEDLSHDIVSSAANESGSPFQTDLFEEIATSNSLAGDHAKHTKGSVFERFAEHGELSLKGWVSAYSDPLRYYYRERLGLATDDGINLAEEDEPFALDGLSTYSLAIGLSDVWQDCISVEDFIKQQRLAGTLPQEPVGSTLVHGIQDRYTPFFERIVSFQDVRQERLSLTLPSTSASENAAIGSTNLNGSIYLCDKGLVDVRFSKNIASWFFGAWAQHVAWNVFLNETGKEEFSGVSGQSHLLTPTWYIVLPELGLERASQYLQALCDYFETFWNVPTPLLKRVAFDALRDPSKSIERHFASIRQRPDSYGDEQQWWLRYCTLSDSERDEDQAPDLTQEIIFQQIAGHISEEANATDEGENADDALRPIVFESYKL